MRIVEPHGVHFTRINIVDNQVDLEASFSTSGTRCLWVRSKIIDGDLLLWVWGSSVFGGHSVRFCRRLDLDTVGVDRIVLCGSTPTSSRTLWFRGDRR